LLATTVAPRTDKITENGFTVAKEEEICYKMVAVLNFAFS